MAHMPRVLVFSMTYCPYCVRAKKLLQERGVTFEETVVAEDDEATWQALEKRSGGMKTVPQIYVQRTQADGTLSEKCLGGYTDLVELERQGRWASEFALNQ